ncbi:MAG: hypothetical protein H7330_16370 [Hymenobacteraceae bacterium]|nr:hypothetical protein [Hymenobacteraceae bacterium]
MHVSLTSAARSLDRFFTRTAASAAAGLFLLVSLPGAAQTGSAPGHLQAHLPLRRLQVVDLGMGRATGFLLRAHNVGRRCLALFERTAAGDTISRGLLGPDATVTLTLAPGSAAFVQNPPKRRELRNSLLGRAVFEFEVINGTDDNLKNQFVHQVCAR